MHSSVDFNLRRADIDAKQAVIGEILQAMECEWALLLMPAHVAWITGGMNIRGLIADSERPGVFTNGRQRWLICSNVDTQRLFDEELDGLGFQLKEWNWSHGRAGLIGEIVSGKRVAGDRPFPNIPLLTDRLRPHLRVLTLFDQERYLRLGKLVSHALEATARTLSAGESEEEVAGQIAHRLLHRGAEVVGISVVADGRGRKFRRSGFTAVPVRENCVLQATALKDGQYVTAARTVSLHPPDAEFRKEYDAACRVSGIYRALSHPGGTVAEAAEEGCRVLEGSPFEHEWRQSQVGYGTGWFPAEELRRGGQDDPFAVGQPLVWQSRVGVAAIIDTVLVGESGPIPVTIPEYWPFKRVKLGESAYDVPDILIRNTESP
ncbi:MAG: M24 family metallopeptidase [Bacteroidales bacterium]|nr:M24 family metallopeptidase [Bacteroidales bacterium]